MYARKLAAEIVIGAERRPVPLDWLDSFCMRNFTGSAEFDDTLPMAEGGLEAGLSVESSAVGCGDERMVYETREGKWAGGDCGAARDWSALILRWRCLDMK